MFAKIINIVIVIQIEQILMNQHTFRTYNFLEFNEVTLIHKYFMAIFKYKLIDSVTAVSFKAVVSFIKILKLYYILPRYVYMT